MNKKAKIVTFHCVPNYGAVLQAYALQTILCNFFKEVEIIDYCPPSLISEYNVINTYSYKSILYSLWSLRPYLKKIKKFQSFREKHMNISSKRYVNLSEVEDYDTDFFFLGSDQIWNPEITKGFDPVYFGLFKCKADATIVSYAASLGKEELTTDECKMIMKLIKNIDYLSVREEEAKNILSNYINKEINVVLDPTLLLDKEKWNSLTSEIKYSNYLLYYSLNGYDETEALAKNIADYLGLTLIELSGKRKPIINKTHITIYDAGPEEFLSFIKKANYVVTDSFHGTVFSVIFERPFITIPHKTRGGRIITFLNKMGLIDRMLSVFNAETIKQHYNINYVNNKLALERKNSINFIENAIKKDEIGSLKVKSKIVCKLPRL